MHHDTPCKAGAQPQSLRCSFNLNKKQAGQWTYPYLARNAFLARERHVRTHVCMHSYVHSGVNILLWLLKSYNNCTVQSQNTAAQLHN